ncbi:dihydrofolate reductase [Kiritimatiellaeota bacterium B1221]|nr:dihydrofolate reductase [Kiritimatiellaeota bacterium B1221]
MTKPELVLIVAMDRQRVIGKENQLPWRLSADLKAFKQRTLGSPILMGRKTWESIGRPLPGRKNLVMSRQADFIAEGAVVVSSIEDALSQLTDNDCLFVIGGEEIYRLCLPQAQRLIVTYVDTVVEGGDAWFPEWDKDAFVQLSAESYTADERNEFDFKIIEYGKKDSDR